MLLSMLRLVVPVCVDLVLLLLLLLLLLLAREGWPPELLLMG